MGTARDQQLCDGYAMKNSGVTAALRLSAAVAAIAFTAAACGGSSNTASTRTDPAPTPTSTTTSSPTSLPTSKPAPSLPPGCSGMAVDLKTTVAVLTDGAQCPGSVNSYWTEQLGAKWTEPTFIAYRDGEIPETECAEGSSDPDDFADNAFYCPLDDTISYSEDLLDELYEQGGPYLPVVVLEHELGHRASKIAGTVGVISRSEENQADCLAGVTTAYARTAQRLPLSDVVSAAKLLYRLGDTRNFGTQNADSPDAHGNPAQRVVAFGRGYFQDIDTCHALGESKTGAVSQFG